MNPILADTAFATTISGYITGLGTIGILGSLAFVFRSLTKVLIAQAVLTRDVKQVKDDHAEMKADIKAIKRDTTDPPANVNQPD